MCSAAALKLSLRLGSRRRRSWQDGLSGEQVERGQKPLADLAASLEVSKVLAQLVRKGVRDGRVECAEARVLLQLCMHAPLGLQRLLMASPGCPLHICFQLGCTHMRGFW